MRTEHQTAPIEPTLTQRYERWPSSNDLESMTPPPSSDATAYDTATGYDASAYGNALATHTRTPTPLSGAHGASTRHDQGFAASGGGRLLGPRAPRPRRTHSRAPRAGTSTAAADPTRTPVDRVAGDRTGRAAPRPDTRDRRRSRRLVGRARSRRRSPDQPEARLPRQRTCHHRDRPRHDRRIDRRADSAAGAGGCRRLNTTPARFAPRYSHRARQSGTPSARLAPADEAASVTWRHGDRPSTAVDAYSASRRSDR